MGVLENEPVPHVHYLAVGAGLRVARELQFAWASSGVLIGYSYSGRIPRLVPGSRRHEK